MSELQFGLARHGRKLCYGWKHGFGCGWLPDRVQNGIVDAWNLVACAVWGHDFIPDFDTATDRIETDTTIEYLGVTHELCTACSFRQAVAS